MAGPTRYRTADRIVVPFRIVSHAKQVGDTRVSYEVRAPRSWGEGIRFGLEFDFGLGLVFDLGFGIVLPFGFGLVLSIVFNYVPVLVLVLALAPCPLALFLPLVSFCP